MTLTRFRRKSAAPGRMPLLKKLFWVYFLLLIFEGAIRKWFLPQLSAPLLLVRDPVAFLIIWEAYRKHKWPAKWSSVVGILTALLFCLSILQVVFGIAPWFAVLYGLRSYLLPFPVAFIMAENLDAEDLQKFAVCTLWLLLPLTLLEVVQYSSPATSFWNKGASVGSVQLSYAGGHVRASATFSYVTGPACYIPMAAAFIFYGLAKPGYIKKWLLWAASCALVLSIPVTGSRTVAFELAALLACVSIAALFGVSQFVKSLQVILAMAFVALLVSRLPVFSEATDTMMERFTSASNSEGGSASQVLLSRIASPIAGTIEDNISSGNWMGEGVGLGAAAIAQLMVGTQFGLVGEGEFERVIGEFGWPCGLVFMLIRLVLALTIVAKALGKAREFEPLAWLLVPLTFPCVFLDILEQPTEQGFTVLAIAFSLAALRLGVSLPSRSASLDPRLRRLHARAPITVRQGMP